jgi:hypothetical protein
MPRIYKKDDEGNITFLEDGAVFQVDGSDRQKIETWLINDSIDVSPSSHPSATYKLTNSEGAWVFARRVD